MDESKKYYVVVLEAFAFETREEAYAYSEALQDAFMAMPESNGYGAGTRIEERERDAA